MTEAQYLAGLVLLLIGFNIGFYEAGKGLTVADFKQIVARLVRKERK